MKFRLKHTWIYQDKKMQKSLRNSGFIPAKVCGLQNDMILLCLASSTTPRRRNCRVHCISLPVVVVVLKFPNVAGSITMTKDFLISHGRLAFFAQPQRLSRFYLHLLVGLHGNTDTTSRKSAIEKNMFWKVTILSGLIFFCKRYCND